MSTLIENFAMLPYRYDDGGRKIAGYKGTTGDCVIRAIAIYKSLPYIDVRTRARHWGYMDWQWNLTKGRANGHFNKKIKKPGSAMEKMFIDEFGLSWVKSDFRQVHGRWRRLCIGDLPNNCIASMRKHVVAIRLGIVCDTWNCTKQYLIVDDWGNERVKHRAVYGFWV